MKSLRQALSSQRIRRSLQSILVLLVLFVSFLGTGFAQDTDQKVVYPDVWGRKLDVPPNAEGPRGFSNLSISKDGRVIVSAGYTVDGYYHNQFIDFFSGEVLSARRLKVEPWDGIDSPEEIAFKNYYNGFFEENELTFLPINRFDGSLYKDNQGSNVIVDDVLPNGTLIRQKGDGGKCATPLSNVFWQRENSDAKLVGWALIYFSDKPIKVGMGEWCNLNDPGQEERAQTFTLGLTFAHLPDGTYLANPYTWRGVPYLFRMRADLTSPFIAEQPDLAIVDGEWVLGLYDEAWRVWNDLPWHERPPLFEFSEDYATKKLRQRTKKHGSPP